MFSMELMILSMLVVFQISELLIGLIHLLVGLNLQREKPLVILFICQVELMEQDGVFHLSLLMEES